jgi:lactoylglutathione lyase
MAGAILTRLGEGIHVFPWLFRAWAAFANRARYAAGMTETMDSAGMRLTGLAHIGIRVHDFERSMKFYAVLGFELTAGPFPGAQVAILSHACGIEINLILNAARPDAENVLMDVEEKHPGYTHVALAVDDLEKAAATVEAAGYPITEGPVTFPTGARAVFVRDPDRNVVELHQPV